MGTETYISKIKGKLNGQGWIEDHLVFEARLGSYAYGASLDDTDIDVRGIFVPPKEMLFPFRKRDYIYGFGTQPLKINMFDRIIDEYDVIYYNIVKFFDLMLSNNPNVMNFLFLREKDCTIYTKVADMILENKEVFLSKKIYTTYNGLAESCVKNITKGEKVEKNMYLALRTLFELRDIVTNLDNVDLKKNTEILLRARKGLLSEKEFVFTMDQLQVQNSLREIKSDWKAVPSELEIRNLLWDCLEEYYK